MRRPLHVLALLAALALGASGPAHGQAPGGAPSPGVSSETGPFALARHLLDAGQTARAVAVLEHLVAQDPSSYAARQALREAYEADRRWDDALRLHDERLALGATPDGLAERGATLYRAGREAEAQQAWDAALALAPRAEQTYRTVANVLGGLRLYEAAAAALDQGREALGQPDLYLLERANLYGLAGDHDRTAEAYLAVLARQPEAVQAVQGRLARLVTQEGAPERYRLAVERSIRQDPLNRAFREVAAWLAMERRDYAAALDATLALDRLAREQGQSVYAFALSARAGGAEAEADRALSYLLERHPQSPLAVQALLDRARLDEDRAQARAERTALPGDPPRPTPNADRARDAYIGFSRDHAGRPEAAEALYRLGVLARDVYRDAAGADSLLALALERGAPNEGPIRLDRAELALLGGDLYTARARFTEIEEGERTGPLAEQARFELALIDFYDGYFLSALAQAEALGENTAADVTNDAIALRLTLREGTEGADPAADPEATRPLRLYAQASLLHRRGLAREALATLDTLDGAVSADHPLADQALFLRALALRERGQASLALAALDVLPARFPDSFFLDRALVLAAEIYARDLADPQGARRAYLLLLERHPGSLFAPEARARLREAPQAPPGT